MYKYYLLLITVIITFLSYYFRLDVTRKKYKRRAQGDRLFVKATVIVPVLPHVHLLSYQGVYKTDWYHADSGNSVQPMW